VKTDGLISSIKRKKIILIKDAKVNNIICMRRDSKIKGNLKHKVLAKK
jgi:hypothetical protein